MVKIDTKLIFELDKIVSKYGNLEFEDIQKLFQKDKKISEMLNKAFSSGDKIVNYMDISSLVISDTMQDVISYYLNENNYEYNYTDNIVSDGMKSYLNQIGSIPIYTNEEEKQILTKYGEESEIVDSYKDYIILCSKKEIEKIANNYKDNNYTKKELVSYQANLISEMLDNIRSFDSKKQKYILDTDKLNNYLKESIIDLKNKAKKSNISEYSFKKLELDKDVKECYNEYEKHFDLKRFYRNEIMEHNLRLVISIAKRYVNQDMSLEDAIQYGNEGLVKSIDKFDIQRNCRFSTYATWWIRQTILRALGDYSRTIRIPIHVGEKIAVYYRARKKFLEENYREPTNEELCQLLGWNLAELNHYKLLSVSTISLNQAVGEREHGVQTEIQDFVIDEESPSVEEKAITENIKVNVRDSLNILRSNEKLVIALRFGLVTDNSFLVEQGKNLFLVLNRTMNFNEINQILRENNIEYTINSKDNIKSIKNGVMYLDNNLKIIVLNYDYPKTLDEIGKMMLLTRERIRQIEARALKKLRFNPKVKSLND